MGVCTYLELAILANFGVGAILRASRLTPPTLGRVLLDALGLVALGIDLAALPVVALLGLLELAIFAGLGVGSVLGTPGFSPPALRRVVLNTLGLVALSIHLAALPAVALLAFLLAFG